MTQGGDEASVGRVELLGIPVLNATERELLQAVTARTSLLAIHSLNGEILAQTRSDSRLALVLKKGSHNIADGYWVDWFLKRKYRSAYRGARIAGVDLAFGLAHLCASRGWKIGILGGSPEACSAAVANLENRFGGLQACGIAPGAVADCPSGGDAQGSLIREFLLRERPRVLLVCLGAPKQELWIERSSAQLEEAGVRVALSAGGTVDFIGGNVKRAPKLMQSYGLEWFFRLLCQPWRVRRQAWYLPVFLMQAIVDVGGEMVRRSWRDRGS